MSLARLKTWTLALLVLLGAGVGAPAWAEPSADVYLMARNLDTDQQFMVGKLGPPMGTVSSFNLALNAGAPPGLYVFSAWCEADKVCPNFALKDVTIDGVAASPAGVVSYRFVQKVAKPIGISGAVVRAVDQSRDNAQLLEKADWVRVPGPDNSLRDYLEGPVSVDLLCAIGEAGKLERCNLKSKNGDWNGEFEKAARRLALKGTRHAEVGRNGAPLKGRWVVVKFRWAYD